MSFRDADKGSNLGVIAQLVEPRMGKLPLMGRYHKLPRKLSGEYQLTSKVLGTGCNGSVRMATSRSLKHKQSFAVKTFNTKSLKPEKLAHLQAEIEIFMCMDHPHVARLVDVYEAEHNIQLVMECMSGGELFNRITVCKKLSEPAAAHAMRQMLLAVSYVHSHSMVHRDLKLENWLYDTQNSNHLKLIDFGFSKFLDTRSRMKTSCGTLAYVAPEVLRKNYTSQCDLWSMGVICFILLSGHMPFFGKEESQVQDIAGGKYVMKPDHWRGISSRARSFVRSLLQVNPDKRLTALAGLEHCWITGHCPELRLDFQPLVSALQSWILAPKLLRAFFSMMAWSLTNKQQVTVRDHFLAMDTNHNGAVSLSELRSIMVEKYGVSEAEVVKVFNLFIENHDEEMHYSDFLAAMACDHIDLDDDVLLAAFQKFDTRGIGYINATDFHDVLGVNLDGGHADQLVREADVIEQDGHIVYEEFVEYVRVNRLRMKQESMSCVSDLAPKTAAPKCQAPSPPPAPALHAPTLLEANRAQAALRCGQKPQRSCTTDSMEDVNIFQKLEARDSCCSLM